MTEEGVNLDPGEVGKFDALATRWWDPNGDLKTLHDINPVRSQYVDERARLGGKQVIDIGCGGGILAEEMARRGAQVTGIDASESAITVAGLQQLRSGSRVRYVHILPETYEASHAGRFDAVTCMELLEHVPYPAALVASCARLVRPGGRLFFSTLHRTPLSYLAAVIAGEYVLGLLPKGTHRYERFIRPAELAAWLRAADLDLIEVTGMSYNPVTRRAALSKRIAVNYLVHAVRR